MAERVGTPLAALTESTARVKAMIRERRIDERAENPEQFQCRSIRP
jgi:hypothetical protein